MVKNTMKNDQTNAQNIITGLEEQTRINQQRTAAQQDLAYMREIGVTPPSPEQARAQVTLTPFSNRGRSDGRS